MSGAKGGSTMPSSNPMPNRMIAPEMIDCIGADRAPTPDEVARVAQHIRADLAGSSAFAWGDASGGEAEQLVLRAAHAALTGKAPD
jgi:hypothetical protein